MLCVGAVWAPAGATESCNTALPSHLQSLGAPVTLHLCSLWTVVSKANTSMCYLSVPTKLHSMLYVQREKWAEWLGYSRCSSPRFQSLSVAPKGDQRHLASEPRSDLLRRCRSSSHCPRYQLSSEALEDWLSGTAGDSFPSEHASYPCLSPQHRAGLCRAWKENRGCFEELHWSMNKMCL